MDGLRVPRAGAGRPRRRREAVIADKAYSSRALRRRGVRAVIPERDDQKSNRLRRGKAGGRPPAFDRDLYKARNVVERCFGRLKQFRAIAPRFDELAARYKAGVHLAALILWLREPTQDAVHVVCHQTFGVDGVRFPVSMAAPGHEINDDAQPVRSNFFEGVEFLDGGDGYRPGNVRWGYDAIERILVDRTSSAGVKKYLLERVVGVLLCCESDLPVLHGEDEVFDNGGGEGVYAPRIEAG